MINVSVYNEGNYKIFESKIKSKLREVLKKEGITSTSVSVAIVSTKKMDELVKKYYKGDPKNLYIHPILTFPYNDENGLGEIIISYDEAKSEDKLLSLVEHGAMHLLGIHHN